METGCQGASCSRSYGRLLAIICSLAFASYFTSSMRLPVMPLFAVSLGAGPAAVGLINSAFLLMMGLLSLPLGLLADRLGRRLLVVGGLLIAAATSFLLYRSQTVTELVWIYLIFGVGLAMIGPTLMAAVADISPATHLGRSYGWYTTAIYAGMSLGPGVGGWLADIVGLRQVFLLTGILILLQAGAVWAILPVRVHAAGAAVAAVGLRAAPAALLGNRPLLACLLVTMGGCFAQGMFVTFAPLHAHDHGLTAGQIGLIFAAHSVANAGSRLPLGRWADRVTNRAHLVVLGFLLFNLFLALFGLMGNLAGFLLVAMALGVGLGLAFTPLGALVSEVAPREARGLAMGGYNSAIYLGMMASAGGMGPVVTALGYPASFGVTAVASAGVTGIFFLLMRGAGGRINKSVDGYRE